MRWADRESRTRANRRGGAPTWARGGLIAARAVGAAIGLAAAIALVLAFAQEPSAGGGERDAHQIVGTHPIVRAAKTVPSAARHRKPRRASIPSAHSLRAARSFARRRGGLVSFAVIDTRGKLHGRAEDRQFVSASIVKSMLLAAELRRLADTGLPLDPTTKATLQAMITYSDNTAADTIYDRVGDPGLYAVAKAAGMERFEVSGYWASAQVTAAGMARLFSDLDSIMKGPHRKFALGLLGSIIPAQSWGIPAAAGERWAVRFKGGWRQTDLGSLVHQAAELRDGDRQLSLAVLTDGQPSQEYAIDTIRGIAERLLSRHRSERERAEA